MTGVRLSSAVQDGVAVVTLDSPEEKVNILRRDFLRALETTAAELARRQGVRAAIVLSAKEGGFIAGADLEEIGKVSDPVDATALAAEGQRVFGLWAALPFPVVAAIHGHCIGGGTEFALACHFRIAATDAVLSLPEVRLGIIPGFGGTQRLPRLISVTQALDFILSGRPVRSREALAVGLLDRVVAPDRLPQEAAALARQVAADPGPVLAARRQKAGGWRGVLLERNPLGRWFIFRQARRRVMKKTRGHYPAPRQAIEVMRRGLSLPLAEALAIEARALGPLLTGPVCKNLIHVFNLSQRPKQLFRSGEVTPLHRTAVLGAGVMGSGIAQLLAGAKIPVLLKDIRREGVDAGLEQARAAFHRQAHRRGEDEGWVASRMALIAGTTEYENLADVDLVIEAVSEKMAVKQDVLREVEPLLRTDAVFASNTSALSITQLQKIAERPERVGGMHFFNPVDRMPLVEIIRGEQTAERTIAFLFAQALRLGKTPVLAADRPGFLVNRLLMVYLNEAGLLVESGVERVSLDRAATDFGWPMGPFRLLDEIGIDIAAQVGTSMYGAFSYLAPASVLQKAVTAGLSGKKGNSGFYLYHEGKPVSPNRKTDTVLGLKTVRPAAPADLRRMHYLLVNEAGRCLEERVVALPEDVDTGMVFGAGFPPFRGGLCRWADQEGLSRIAGVLEELTALGPRFIPCRTLLERASFYA